MPEIRRQIDLSEVPKHLIVGRVPGRSLTALSIQQGATVRPIAWFVNHTAAEEFLELAAAGLTYVPEETPDG